VFVAAQRRCLSGASPSRRSGRSSTTRPRWNAIRDKAGNRWIVSEDSRHAASPSLALAPSLPRRDTVGWRVLDVLMEVLVRSTLWMSFSLASLVLLVQLRCRVGAQLNLFGGAVDWRPFWTAVSESVAVYTFDHWRDLKKEELRSRKVLALGNEYGIRRTPANGRRRRMLMLRTLFLVSTAMFFGSLVNAGSWSVRATFMGHVALCFLYAKLKPKMPYLKAAYVSLCVVFMAAAAPSAYAPGLLTALGGVEVFRLCLLIFVLAFTVEHLQDFRDVREDREVGVITIPSGLGPERARRLLLLVQFMGAVLHTAVGSVWNLPLRLGMLMSYVSAGIVAASFGPRTPRCLFQVVLEPLYIVPLLLTVLGPRTSPSTLW